MLVLGVVLFCCGLTIAPTMVAVTACVEEWVPPQRLTEAITWTVTGILLGVAPGNAAAGHAVDLWGPSTAYWVPFCHRHHLRPGRRRLHHLRPPQDALRPQLGLYLL